MCCAATLETYTLAVMRDETGREKSALIDEAFDIIR